MIRKLTALGPTTKIPVSAFSYTSDSATRTIHETGNGSGPLLHRYLHRKGASAILEDGAAAAKNFRYIMTGTLDDLGALPTRGEILSACRENWMPDIPGILHKEHMNE